MTKIQLRHDTKANFERVNPVLLVGEAAVETDTGKFKLGNGTDNYTTLPYTYAIPNLELPLEYKTKSVAYEAYGNIKTQGAGDNYYYDIAGINSSSGFNEGFEFKFKVAINGNIAGAKRYYIYREGFDNTNYTFHLEYTPMPERGSMFLQIGLSGQNKTTISVPGYGTIRHPQYFKFYFNPITKKASIEVYRYEDYSKLITSGEFDITDAQLEVWNNHIKNVTNLNLTIEKSSSDSTDQTYDCRGAEAIPATVTTLYEEDTLIVNKATNTTPGIVQPDNETIGIENGLLTVIDGDPGGTLRTQLNGIQTQVTSLENNKADIQDLDSKANTDLSNLSATGEKHFVNKTQITNCITEIPQRIKYTLIDSVLTIKAGSVVIVPYGVEDLTATYPVGSTFLNNNFKVVDTQYADGKFFIWAELQEDMSHSNNNISGNNARTMYVNFSTGALIDKWANISGANPTATKTYTGAYNTATNLIGQSFDSTTISYTEVLSFPVIKTKPSAPIMHGSVEQVFNGIGYIGAAIFMDKDLKLLIPNGRNADGTLNNIEYTTPKLRVTEVEHIEGVRQNWTLAICANGDILKSFSEYTHIQSTYPSVEPQAGNEFWYNPVTNETIDFNLAVPNKKPFALLPNLYTTDATERRIISMRPLAVTAFQAANAQDIDGIWVSKTLGILTNVSMPKDYSKDFDLSNYLPNDGNLYEVVLDVFGRTAATSGSIWGIEAKTSLYSVLICKAMAPTNTAIRTVGNANIVVGQDRVLTIRASGSVNTATNVGVNLKAYRKVR